MSQVRTGLRAEVAACVDLWLSAITARDGAIQDPAALRTRITKKFDQPIVRFAVIGDWPTGFALTVHRSGTYAFLDLLAVAPDRVGGGIGRALLKDAIRTTERLGYQGLELQVREGNLPALTLYRSERFVPTGESEPHPLGGAPMITLRSPRPAD